MMIYQRSPISGSYLPFDHFFFFVVFVRHACWEGNCELLRRPWSFFPPIFAFYVRVSAAVSRSTLSGLEQPALLNEGLIALCGIARAI